MAKRTLRILLIGFITLGVVVPAKAQVTNITNGVGVKKFVSLYDMNLVILCNGELWGYGSDNSFFHTTIIHSKVKGSNHQDNKEYYIAGKIADNVEDVVIQDYNDNLNILFITQDSSLWGLGENKKGDLGLGHKNTVSQPTKIMDNVKSAYLTQYGTSGALTKDNILFGWGKNEFGSLGNGTKNEVLSPAKIYSNVKEVISFDNLSCIFITNLGEVYGAGRFYSLTTYAGEYASELKPVLLLSGVDSVTYDNGRLIYYRYDGSVWGYTLTEWIIGWYKSPSKLPAYSNDISMQYNNIIGGDNSSNATFTLKKDGTLWVSGDNKYGELGIGHKSEIKEPYKIMEGVKEFIHSGYTYLALKKNGEIFGWGAINRFIGGETLSPLKNITTSPVKLFDNVEKFYTSYRSSNEIWYIKKDGSLYSLVNWINGKHSVTLKPLEIVGPSTKPIVR